MYIHIVVHIHTQTHANIPLGCMEAWFARDKTGGGASLYATGPAEANGERGGNDPKRGVAWLAVEADENADAWGELTVSVSWLDASAVP